MVLLTCMQYIRLQQQGQNKGPHILNKFGLTLKLSPIYL